MPVEKEIRKALEAAIEAGRTSMELEKASGVNNASIRQFKAGMRTMSIHNLERLAVALGLQVVVTKGTKKK